MAEIKEHNIRFGWLTKQEMLDYIGNGTLNAYDICFTRDTHEQYFISSSLDPISIKSRIRIFGSVDDAIDYARNDSTAYEGEILSIRDNDKFIAYIIDTFPDGTHYVTPICTDGQVNYDDLINTPIKNINGTVTEPIVLAELPDGHYKITGHFITPKGNEVSSLIGNYIIVESLGFGTKAIKRVGSDNIFDYHIDSEGVCTTDKYATEEYVKNQGYVTSEEVDIKLEAFKLGMEEYIKEYVSTTCTLLVKELINQELNHRYSTEQDIENLFEN